MPDPLSAVADATLKTQLLRLRECMGSMLSSEQLRREIRGFKGQKGIYKPAGSDYALWVRQTLRQAYPDQAPEYSSDGSWTYRYSPEGREGAPDLSLDTNRSLLRCREDHVPIGVLLQREGDRTGRVYEVLGLAFVQGYDGSHFILRGEPIDWDSEPTPAASVLPFEPFDRGLIRKPVIFQIQREKRFAWTVNQAYHEKCSLCELGFRLRGESIGTEAAHVIPVSEGGTSKDVRNGILLCRNHHVLFDSWAWTLDEDRRVVVADDKDFRSTAIPNHVLALEGKLPPNLPRVDLQPDPVAIRHRLDEFHRFWG